MSFPCFRALSAAVSWRNVYGFPGGPLTGITFFAILTPLEDFAATEARMHNIAASKLFVLKGCCAFGFDGNALYRLLYELITLPLVGWPGWMTHAPFSASGGVPAGIVAGKPEVV